MNKPLTNDEARRLHLKLPHKVRKFRQRGNTLTDKRYARRKKKLLNETVANIKIERGCESGCCPVQGELFAPELAFHHCVGEKLSDVTKICSLPAALREIEKCLVLCHICHSRVHNGRIDLANVILAKWPDHKPKRRPRKNQDDPQLQLFS